MKFGYRFVVAVALIVGIASCSWYVTARAQEAEAAATPRLGDDEAGRLPAGYTVVVTKAQRATIYKIQDSYQSQLEDLRKQIAAIEAKRDAEIEALLDDEQKKILEYVLKLRERERQQDAGDN